MNTKSTAILAAIVALSGVLFGVLIMNFTFVPESNVKNVRDINTAYQEGYAEGSAETKKIIVSAMVDLVEQGESVTISNEKGKQYTLVEKKEDSKQE